MKCFVAIFLLLAVYTLKSSAQNVELLQRYGEPRKVGIVHLIQLIDTPQLFSQNEDEIDNSITGRNEFNSLPSPSKLLNTLTPSNNFNDEIKNESRLKRSPSKCARCGGGGGGGGGGRPGHGGFGGGGGGSWSQSSASASSGSFGGGYGKGGYGK